MVDENSSDKKAKTKTIATIDKDTLKKVPGWTEHQGFTKALTKAREDSENSKDKLRDTLLNAMIKAKKRRDDGTAIDKDTEIDFTVEGDGSLRIVEVLDKGKGRSKSQDFSDIF